MSSSIRTAHSGRTQNAGAARSDIGVAEVKAILVGCQAMQSYNSALAERMTDVVFDALRAPR